MKIATIGPLFSLGWLACLLAAGCRESGPDLCEPSVPAGSIQGFVRVGEAPVDAIVRATRVASAPGDVAMIEAAVRPDGSYAMDVPAGRYVVGLRLDDSWSLAYEYSRAGLRFGDAPPDTLVVDSRHSLDSVDFDLASLRVHLDLSTRLDGESGFVLLHRRGLDPAPPGRTDLRGGGGTIAGGGLDLVVAGVLPGTYRIEVIVGRRAYLCYCPYDGEHFWIPGVRDSTDSPWLEVPVDRTIEITGRVGPEPARIQGRITGAWLDLGLSPPSLALLAPDSTIVRGLRPVEADGSFDVEMYVPGLVKLLVDHDGIGQWIGGRSFEEAASFDLEAGRTISGVQFVQCGMRIELSAGFSGIASPWFRLYDAATLALAAAWRAQDGSDLVLGLPNLRPGTYRMHIEPDWRGLAAWAPQWFDRATSPAEAATITLGQEGEIARVAVALEKGGTISGLIREVQGVTADYFVYVTSAGDPTLWGSTFAYSFRLSFEVEGLPDGDWKVGAWRRLPAVYPEQPPTGTVWYPGTTDWQAATVIPIRGFEDVTGIEIVMPGGQSPRP